MKHDTVAVHYFVRLLLQFLTSVLTVSKVYYFSDGAASQYKNKKNFLNLAFHESDFHIPAEWHFFATSHGKGPCDGVGGTVKRLATRTSLQRPFDNQIQTPKQLYEWAKGAITSVEFRFVETSEIESEESLLHERLEAAETVSGTHNFHAYLPLATTRNHLTVKRYSNAVSSTTVRLANLRELIPRNEISGYIICEYDQQWWLAFVLERIDERHEVKVRFLHPAGPSPSFTFPKINDDLVIAHGHVIMAVNPTTPTGRTYQLSAAVAAEATAKLNMKNT